MNSSFASVTGARTSTCGSPCAACLSRQVLSPTFWVSAVLPVCKHSSLQALWWRVPRAYPKKLIYTDGYRVYGEFFRPWQHRPTQKSSGRTSVAEGLNNKWRNRVSGLVRRSVCVQHEADLDGRLLLVFEQHNGHCRHRLEKLGWA